MNTVGPVALLGGGEHLPGTRDIERAVLRLVGATRPQVVVLPVASARRQVGTVAALARNHWTALGAAVQIAMPDGNGSREALDAVAGADVVVITGGVPNRIVAALGASPVWGRILQRWHDGAAVVGSSAGAMCLFSWRIRLYPPHPLALVPGLGPLDGYLAAPHFSRFHGQRWAMRVTGRFRGLGVVGLDERTALVGHRDRYTVVGSGAVTLIEHGRLTAHGAGETLHLDLDPQRLSRGPWNSRWRPSVRSTPDSTLPQTGSKDLQKDTHGRSAHVHVRARGLV